MFPCLAKNSSPMDTIDAEKDGFCQTDAHSAANFQKHADETSLASSVALGRLVGASQEQWDRDSKAASSNNKAVLE